MPRRPGIIKLVCGPVVRKAVPNTLVLRLAVRFGIVASAGTSQQTMQRSSVSLLPLAACRVVGEVSYPVDVEFDLIFPRPGNTYKRIYPFPIICGIRNAAAIWPFQLSYVVMIEGRSARRARRDSVPSPVRGRGPGCDPIPQLARGAASGPRSVLRHTPLQQSR